MDNVLLLPAKTPLHIDELIGRAWNMDMLDLLALLPGQSVDAIIADPPYNVTELDFDKQVVDWSAFWLQARRVLRTPKSPVILFSQQPFTTDLIMSNRKWYRDEIVYEKTMPVGFLNANRRPLECHELIEIFAEREPEYWPQMENTTALVSDVHRKNDQARHYSDTKCGGTYKDNGKRYPRSVWRFAQRHNAFENTRTLHPTEKPIALMERLILTYTAPGWLIVDPFCGSGTTGRAAQNTGRQFIVSDNDKHSYDIANHRVNQPFTFSMFEQTTAS